MSTKRTATVFLTLLFLFCILTKETYAEPLQTRVFYHGSREEKVVALTFDDGPHPRYTPQILSLLEKYDIKATFFVIGKNLENYPEAGRLLLSSYHEIGNHTYSHPHMKNISSKSFEDEIRKTEDIITKLGGKPTALFRPPEGTKSSSQLTLISHMSYKTILWSIDTRDWAHDSPETIYQKVIKNIKGGDIILFHDYVDPPSNTITALERLIPQLLQDGYRFVTVSELLAQPSSSAEAAFSS